ncbi:MAG TPA: DUF3108 domain-containing protein [Longimicrobium sp.]|nr:DUF3108 domain-containing protein [Longimicrobium sp.]
MAMQQWRINRVRAGAALGAAVAVLLGSAAGAQQQRLPFSSGERAEYQVKLGGVGVGRGSLEVVGLENIRGQSTFRTRMRVNGRALLVTVNDTYESWIDTDQLFSRRFHQNVQEARYRRNRTFDFFPEQGTWRRENGSTGTLPTREPLDDLSFIYYARTLPLEPGQTHTIRRYFKQDGNPVTIQVLRRETVRVPAGQFRTVVVRPIIQTDGLFGEGGRAEVYFTDDARRIPVLIRSRVPVVGHLTMHLRTYRAGS